VATLKGDKLVQTSAEKEMALTYQAVALALLLAFDNAEYAVRFAKEGLSDTPNPRALIIYSIALIRFRRYNIYNSLPLLTPYRYVFKSWAEAVEILDSIREALLQDPKDLFIIQNYLGFLVTLMQSIGTPECPINIPTILSELQLCLVNDTVDKLQIAHTGVQLWFKQFEDPLVQARLMDEEREGEKAGLTANDAYIQGLTSGAFKDLLLDPFFVQALSEVVLPFPQVERIIGPFRSSLLTLKPNQTAFDIASSFMYAIALQVLKTNYLWEVKAEDERALTTLINAANKMLQAPVDTLIVSGEMDKTLLHHLTLIAMFKPLSSVSGLEDLAFKLDLTKLNPLFVTLLNKSIFSPNEEDEIRDSLKKLTAIPSDSELLDYYQSRVTPAWDVAPVAVISKVSYKQELEWRYSYYKPSAAFNNNLQVLIAGCGSGKELCQTLITYRDMDVTCVDFSSKNLAYAVRQNTELGFTGKFFLADILQLTPSHFPSLFDVINANDVLHYVSDPVAHLKALGNLLKPGGVMTVTLHNKRLTSTLKYVRTILAPRFSTPVFDTSNIPRLLRIPTDQEIRIARQKLLEAIEGKNPAVEVAEIISTTAFYSLNEFRDLVFHPQLRGFTFANVGEMLQKAGLELVGFDFPELLNEKELAYHADFPDDPDMKNYQHLDEFDAKEPSAFSGLFLSFTCQKPI
jgi:2-polyprenyl-3-methyl-5-hydroxy-6-metoxy-1,4-benzoquinol methylase